MSSSPARFAATLAIAALGAGLIGCATASGGSSAPDVGAAPTASASPTAASGTAASGESAAAKEQAQAWLDAATLPPGAIRSTTTIYGFLSYTGWPCGPIEELEGFWTIPGATVTETANWLMANPTADLVTTVFGPYPDDPVVDSINVGYSPADASQQGVVYSVLKTTDGVAVRAEVAALTASATCPTPPGGGSWGAPGQG